jgi:ABC-2 type transport system ATP-binding protein
MSQAAVEVESLVVRYGKFTAVDDVSFRVAPGEIFGFLGANGAGKTTTIRVLCGLILPTSGRVFVAGHAASGDLTPIKRKVGYMSQRFTLYNDLTVEQNLRFAAALRRMDGAARDRRMAELFELVGFSEPLSTLVRDLPGGIRQSVSLAAAMLHDPEIVFLDEPTAGVSAAARVRFWEAIGRVAGMGKTVFVTTHYMDEAQECGRIALMRDGKLIALDSPDALKQKAFQEPCFELQAAAGTPPGWIERVKADPSVANVTNHGLRWHMSVHDAAGFRRLLSALGSGISWKPIEPSLEDTFIRLVERA